MIAILAAALAAAAPVDCDSLKGALAQDECMLRQSLEAPQPFDCENRTTQADLNVCSFRDYLRSDIELNKVWTEIAAHYRAQPAPAPIEPGSEFGLLLDAQRSWLTYRGKQCDGEAKGYEGGSIQPLIRNACLARITTARNEELKQLLEEGS